MGAMQHTGEWRALKPVAFDGTQRALASESVMLGYGREIFGLCCAGHKGAGIGTKLKDRPVREERGVGDKDHPAVRLAEASEIRDRQGIALFQNQIEDDDVDRLGLKQIYRCIAIGHEDRRQSRALKVALPKHAEILAAFDDQNSQN